MIPFGLACLAVYAINTWAAADAKPTLRASMLTPAACEARI
ncbi:Uncharacterised protein [Brevundimonas diminuta]|jgi:hypothetical protein|nr:Uncharacterised protein [Brevundimonas diminuta]